MNDQTPIDPATPESSPVTQGPWETAKPVVVAAAAPQPDVDANDPKRRRIRMRTLAHMAAAMQMLTRFRLFQDRAWPTDIYRESITWFPAVGILVGTMGAAIDGIGSIVGLTPFVTAPLAVAGMVWMTGALHEGGLVNLADGFGGGETRGEKMSIMEDSRSGTYGTLALILLLFTKIGALASYGSSQFVFAGLVVAGAWSRMLMPVVASLLKPVSDDDAIAQLGRPSGIRLAVGLVFAVLMALLLAGPLAGGLMLAAGAIAALAVMVLSRSQIGGFNRDVLSTVQQCAELAMLVTLVAFQDG